MKNIFFVIMLLFIITSCKKKSIGKIEEKITDVDGNLYNTVYIGTQHWMAENLKTTKYNDGSPIINVKDNDQWYHLTTGAWAYYNNDETNDAKYGKLYNWYTVNLTTNGNKNVCPTGWHIPVKAEWDVLISFLGGLGKSAGKMKTADTTNWINPNTDASNSSLFSALPGGFRDVNGSFNFMRKSATWWSSTGVEMDSLSAYTLGVNYGYGSDVCLCYKKYGFSIRCIKD